MKPNIINHNFPKNQYYQDITDKHQIVMHHTVSGDSVEGDINWWVQTPAHVATCVIIARNGDIHTLFSSKHWAHHLGIKNWIFKKWNIPSYRRNVALNKGAIGLEIDSWGGLVKRNGKFYHTGNREVSADDVVDYGREIRGFRYYEKYTKEQIASVVYLLRYWNQKYGIPINYNPAIWEMNVDALNGIPGVYTHVSYRPDKSDCHPQRELINALKSI